jgi:hypothetical protein
MFSRISPPLNLNASKKIPKIAEDIEKQIDPRILEESNKDDSLTSVAREFEDGDKVLIEPIDGLDPFDDLNEGSQHGSGIERVLDDGFEALAFYKSFRYLNQNPAPGYWGIFYIKPRVIALSKEIKLDLGINAGKCLEELLKLLYGHEIYHYKVDATCLQHESFSAKLFYRPYRSYVGSLPMSDWWEEAVANHYGLHGIEEAFKNYFESLVKNSPGAYSKGLYKDDGLPGTPRAFLAGQITNAIPGGCSGWGANLMEDILFNELKLTGFRPAGRMQKWDGDRSLSRDLALKNCPQYWISWNRGGKVIDNLLSPSLHEVKKDFIQKYLAGELIPKKSDHEYFRIDNGEQIKCPNPHNKDVMSWEFKNIVFKAGMKIKDFWVERKITGIWKKNVPRSNPLLPIDLDK